MRWFAYSTGLTWGLVWRMVRLSVSTRREYDLAGNEATNNALPLGGTCGRAVLPLARFRGGAQRPRGHMSGYSDWHERHSQKLAGLAFPLEILRLTTDARAVPERTLGLRRRNKREA